LLNKKYHKVVMVKRIYIKFATSIKVAFK
jgi:hypothetical protein